MLWMSCDNLYCMGKSCDICSGVLYGEIMLSCDNLYCMGNVMIVLYRKSCDICYGCHVIISTSYCMGNHVMWFRISMHFPLPLYIALM